MNTQATTPTLQQDVELVVTTFNELLEKRPPIERAGYASVINPSIHRLSAFVTAEAAKAAKAPKAEKVAADTTDAAPDAKKKVKSAH